MDTYNIIWLAVAVCAANAFVLDSGSSREVTQVLTVSNGDGWGSWHTASYCASGTFASGYDMKIEGKQGDGDDTSLNAIRLHCEDKSGTNYGGDIVSAEGPWGTWVGVTSCDARHGEHVPHFLTAFSLQVEQSVHGDDDTAANFVKFRCGDFERTAVEYEISHAPGQGFWGAYGSYSSSCAIGSAICGIQTRMEAPDGDDTALNDAKFFCCKV